MLADDDDREAVFREEIKLAFHYIENGPSWISVTGVHIRTPEGFDLETANRIVREEAEAWGGEWVTALLKLHGLAASQRCDPVPGY